MVIDFKLPIRITHKDANFCITKVTHFYTEDRICYVCRSYRSVLTSVNICHTCILVHMWNNFIEKGITPDELKFETKYQSCKECKHIRNVLTTTELCKVCLVFKITGICGQRSIITPVVPSYKESNSTNMCCICNDENIIKPGGSDVSGYVCMICKERICKICLPKMNSNSSGWKRCPVCRLQFKVELIEDTRSLLEDMIL